MQLMESYLNKNLGQLPDCNPHGTAQLASQISNPKFGKPKFFHFWICKEVHIYQLFLLLVPHIFLCETVDGSEIR